MGAARWKRNDEPTNQRTHPLVDATSHPKRRVCSWTYVKLALLHRHCASDDIIYNNNDDVGSTSLDLINTRGKQQLNRHASCGLRARVRALAFKTSNSIYMMTFSSVRPSTTTWLNCFYMAHWGVSFTNNLSQLNYCAAHRKSDIASPKEGMTQSVGIWNLGCQMD